MLKIYTDGSCLHKANITGSATGPGGWAYVVTDGNKILYANDGSEKDTTNGRMEVLAMANALHYLFYNKDHDVIKKLSDIILISDSQYVINGLKTWLPGWKNKNFSGIKHPELWKKIDEFRQPFLSKLSYQWVKGHNGDPNNELADQLAQNAARKIQ